MKSPTTGMSNQSTIDGINDSVIESSLPDGPVETMPDLQYLYGQLYLLGRYGGEGDEYAPYLTPGEAEDFIERENSLISARVDLTGEKPSIEDVHFDTYTEDDIVDVAHSLYSPGRAVDHSLTHQSSVNGNEPERLAEYLTDRFTRWPDETSVVEVEESHRSGWVITALREVGADHEMMEGVRDTVEDYLDEERRALLTVEIKRSQDTEWKYPGEVEVLQEAMAAHNREKMVDKNAATDSSGEAVDMVSGEHSDVVGVADDPMRYFVSKQQGTFDSFDPDESWRSHPMSERTALITKAAEPFLDGFRHPMYGVHVYYLPYFREEMTPDRARALYEILYEVSAADDEDRASTVQRVYRMFEERDIDATLVFWTVVIDQPHNLRWDVLAEDSAVDGYRLSEVVETHRDVLDSWIYDERNTRESVFPLLPDEDWSILTRDRESLITDIPSGGYIDRTFPYAVGDNDVTADTMRARAQMSIVTPLRTVDAGWLMEQFAERIEQSEGDDGFSETLVGAQLAQLGTLASLGALTASNDNNHLLTKPPTYMTDEETDTQADVDEREVSPETENSKEQTARERREEKLLAYIEAHPPLEEDHERCATFLLGVLIGQISQYQSREERGQTMADQTPIRGVSKQKLQRMLTDVIDKDIAYRAQNSYTSLLYSETVRELVDHILKSQIDDWKLETAQIRFYYANGVAYGLSDYESDTEVSTEETQADGETSAEA